MSATWLIADTHFSHAKTWEEFKGPDHVTPLRPFTSTEEMDETLVSNWNARVRDKDRVYLMGDAVMARRHLSILGRLNGRINLIKGNHDIFRLKDYLPYVDDVSAYRVFDDIILSHIPVHPDSLRKRVNVSGHLHANQVLEEDGTPDVRFLCVSVEQIDYTPISLEEVRQRINQRKEWRSVNPVVRRSLPFLKEGILGSKG